MVQPQLSNSITMTENTYSWFNRLSITRKLYLSIGLLAFIILLEIFTLIFSFRTFSSVRAFVGAEGLWSKAQKDAIFNLKKYTRRGNPSDFKEYKKFILVPIEERKAREEIIKAHPNREIIRAGFLAGRNHPDDIDGMIDLFLRFKNNHFIQKSIRIWHEADLIIERLNHLAVEVEKDVKANGGNSPKARYYLDEINTINEALTLLEDDFSYTLGEASRWLEITLLKIVLGFTFLLGFIGLFLMLHIRKSMVKSIDELIHASHEFKHGNLMVRAKQFSKDELGELAGHFNNMIEALQEKITALSESEAKFYSVFNNNSISISISTFNEKRFVDANQKFLNIVGYTKEEILGKTSQELNMIADQDRRNQLVDMASTKGMIPDFELTLRAKNGELIHALISISTVSLKGETYFISAFYDITEKKKIENSLHLKTLELEASNRELEHFAHISSHDLQEPLRTVSNYVQVFEEDYGEKLDDNGNKYLKSINNAVSRMSSLIKALLDYSRLGRNRTLTLCNCQSLVMHVMEDLNNTIETNQASVSIGQLPTLRVYEPELRQLFQNLISNAIKFKSKDRLPEIQISAHEQETHWQFVVADNGIGIKSDYFQKIFDIFQRLHSNAEYEGSGIGLANCKKITDMHNGLIKVESVVGQGSRFIFTIAKSITP